MGQKTPTVLFLSTDNVAFNAFIAITLVVTFRSMLFVPRRNALIKNNKCGNYLYRISNAVIGYPQKQL